MVLARAHHPDQYLIKAYFTFGSKKIVELVLLSWFAALAILIKEQDEPKKGHNMENGGIRGDRTEGQEDTAAKELKHVPAPPHM